MPATSTRRTQTERSAATRAALADAAIDVLIERGWAAATAVEVCNRVGVSRGAFHHHYDSLPDLLADALRRLYAQMVDPDGDLPEDLVGLVDLAWTAIGDPRFKAVLEAWLAMANDPTLRAGIGPVVAEFAGLVDPDGLNGVLEGADERDFFLTARETLLGLALGRATNGGRPLGHEGRVLRRLRSEAAAFDA
jgi:AcrR family transcriptional regulator